MATGTLGARRPRQLVSLIFERRLKDDTLDDPDLLPPPDEVAAEVVESLEAALASFRSVAAKLQGV